MIKLSLIDIIYNLALNKAMKIIIFGANELGLMIATEFYTNNDITVIDDENYKIEDGESQKKVRERVYKALMDVIDEYKDKRIVIVSHGSAILWLLKQWCDIDLKNKCIIFNDKQILYDNIFNCTTFKLEFDDKKLVNIEKVF